MEMVVVVSVQMILIPSMYNILDLMIQNIITNFLYCITMDLLTRVIMAVLNSSNF